MASENHIAIPFEEESRFKFERELDNKTNIWSFNCQPHLGLINPGENMAFMLPGFCSQLFNTSAVAELRKVRNGDLINISVDVEHPIYRAWAPSPDFALEKGFSKLFRVRFQADDVLGFPILIGDLAL